jgi:peroxiredoxin
MSYNKLFKIFSGVLFQFICLDAKAQDSKIQSIINQLEGLQNFSYKHVYKQKDPTGDTLVMQNHDTFVKAPNDKIYGYKFSLTTFDQSANSNWIDLYDGSELYHIVPSDSTYQQEKTRKLVIQGSLLERLKWMSDFAEKKPGKLSESPDTLINARLTSHLVFNTRDTTINQLHSYTRIHLFIEKATNLPTSILIRSRNADYGNGLNNYYVETSYSDYKFDQYNVILTVPKGFHQAKQTRSLPLLATGTTAPDWNLYNTQGKKVTLAQLKGKVILLDFYFIGCIPCMQTIEPLNKLYEKFKNKNVIIASITGRDGLKAVREFDKNYHINYPGFVDAAETVKAYHVVSFPTFYFIDKKGKIASAVTNYDSGFQSNATAIINRLLAD